MRLNATWLLLILAPACAKTPPPSQPHPEPSAERPDSLVLPPSPLLEPSPLPQVRLPATVRMAFVGDINLGTATLPDGVPPDNGRGLLDRARPALMGDLVVGNFEGVLADTGTSSKCLMKASATPRRRGHSKQLADSVIS